jgi:hypothetical protein
MHSRLARLEKRGRLGSKLQRIPGAQTNMTVRWFTYKVLEKNMEWTGVVFRGLRKGVGRKEIEEGMRGLCEWVEQPRMVSDQLCTIAVVKSVCEAEKIIRGFKTSGLGGIVDIHPYSSVFKNPEKSAEIMFNEYRKRRRGTQAGQGIKVSKLREEGEDDNRSLISEVSGTVEDGEITDTDAPESEGQENSYVLYEYPGSYINRNGEISVHSGVLVKSSFKVPE